MDQPPPPPPHGGVPKSSGLPPGKYDIFVVPQHSSGAGFLYLPSLQPNVNSFAAGFACGLIVVVVFQSMAPAFQTWWGNYQGMGNAAMSMLMIGVGLGAWALGRAQQNKPSTPPPRAEYSSDYGSPGGSPGAGPTPNARSGPGAAHDSSSPPPPPPHSDPPPYSGPPPHSTSNSAPPPHSTSNSAPPPHSASDSAPPPHPQKPAPGPSPEKPKPTWQRQQSSKPKAEAPKGSWEKAREETRRREEERKAKEEEQKRKDEVARKLREQREREAKEREQREREARDRREKLEAERRQRMDSEKREKELREKLEQERLEREKLEREKNERDRAGRLERERLEKLERDRVERLERERFIREAREREARERATREKDLEEMRKREEEEAKAAKKASTYAYSSMGEKINPWPNGKPKPPPAPPHSSFSTPPRPPPSTTFTSPNDDDQRPPAPSVNTFTGTEEDTYSYRPYDKPKQAGRGRKNSLSSFSETSWTPSHTTARTSPPPSMRAPYTTKDPDKIVIKAVYLFLNQFSKTPVSQLVSGVGSVTDGLILRATTEGLFIDDDVRGVPQREWDVKAWTLKQVEVWCPPHCLTPSPHTPGASATGKSGASAASAKLRDRGVPRMFVGDDADTYLTEMLRACKDCCRMGLCEATFRNTNVPSPTGQTGEWRAKGLHILRATIRDQEGKRYVFVLGEEESWKVAVGLQRLRRGTQARALGVGALSSADARGSLEMLGWV